MRKDARFLKVINDSIIYKLLKDFTNKEVVLSRTPLLYFYIQGPQMTSSKNLENKIPSETLKEFS